MCWPSLGLCKSSGEGIGCTPTISGEAAESGRLGDFTGDERGALAGVFCPAGVKCYKLYVENTCVQLTISCCEFGRGARGS